jgi:transcriptional regulator with XRE-family HTH domain
VSQQQIAALESPDANLTLSTLLKVAKALGHDVEIGISTSSPRKGRKLQTA